MLKDLTYIIFDFETTGLDIKKDEPIQFGLLKFDKKFNILGKFSTYIKPRKQISELKEIVSFITGIKLKDLQNAPYMDEVLPGIKKFFDNKTVVLGHNIDFDYKVLKNYWKDFEVIEKIDTFIVAKTLFHFFPSYSLEVLFEFVKDELNIDISEYGQAHDALVDSMMVYYFFKYSISYLEKLIIRYPILLKFIQNSDSFWKKIIDIKQFSNLMVKNNKEYFLPTLKKEVPPKRKLITKNSINFESFGNFQKIEIGEYNLTKFISEIISSSHKLIFSVSNKGKLLILQQILTDIGVLNFGYLSKQIKFLEENIKKFINKRFFKEFEVNFLIKYFSHIYQGYSYLDVNSFEEYKILNFLTEIKGKKLSDIIITTHSGLYSAIDEGIDFSDYILFFMDWDWWYITYSKYVNQPIDLYKFLNKLEIILYYLKFYFSEDLVIKFEKIVNQFIIFMGVFFIELTKKFKGVSISRIELSPIQQDIDFWQTNKIYDQFKRNLINFSKYLLSNDDFIKILNDILYKLNEIFSNIVNVERRLIGDNKFYFVFYLGNKIVDYETFVEFLDKKFNKVIFCKV